MSLTPEEWSDQKKILVILAHPDDPEFFCGATIARWTSAGHLVNYCLLTRGDKGAQDRNQSPIELASIRENEQRSAASVLGVSAVRFLNYPDGALVPDLGVRREVTRVIREQKPDVVVTCDPLNIFPANGRINHPDHRAAGQVVIDALFPAAGNPMFFPELLNEGLEPHSVQEVWISLTREPNVTLDVTPFWETKIRALHEHISQIGEPVKFDERMHSRRTADSTPEAPRYEETFRRLILG
jgi:LmbE family N-acetylglucosaminyl deacetylase